MIVIILIPIALILISITIIDITIVILVVDIITVCVYVVAIVLVITVVKTLTGTQKHSSEANNIFLADTPLNLSAIFTIICISMRTSRCGYDGFLGRHIPYVCNATLICIF